MIFEDGAVLMKEKTRHGSKIIVSTATLFYMSLYGSV